MKTEVKLQQFKDILNNMGSVLVAYSGGVDSTFLMVLAHEVLGEKALAVFGHSPVCPPGDLEEAIGLAQQFGFRYRTIETNELEDTRFIANTPDRCYYCKQELFHQLQAIATAERLVWIADGTNQDDLRDYRPGMKACRELNIRSPLCEAGLTKDEIRRLSRLKGLPTWDKPASPCLASRIPYGTPVTSEILKKISDGEQYLHRLGIRELRLRHHGEIARIEINESEIPLLLKEDIRHQVTEKIKSLGYLYATLDLAGYHSGSLNVKFKPASGAKE